jgi:hypothetical protein
MGKHVHAGMVAAQQKKPLRVILRQGLVTDTEAMAANIRKFVGVSMESRIGNPDYGKLMTTDLVDEVPGTDHYLRNIAEGHLVGADEDSARRGAAWGGVENWRTCMATEDELKLAAAALESIARQDEENERKVALASKNPVPDPKKLAGPVTNAPAAKSDEPQFTPPPKL